MTFFIADPKFPTKNAIKKNLEPLVIKETTIKYNKLKLTKPLVIVKSLNGIGENPAMANKVIQAIVPPSEDILSFKNEVMSTPYSSNILTPISLKKTYPIKYPKHAPRTEPIVAIKAILTHSFFFAIVIGIIKTSGGIGKIKLSIKDIMPRKNFELLCPASLIVLKYKSLNIFSFIILHVLILLFILYEIYYLWANGGTGRRVGLKIQ